MKRMHVHLGVEDLSASIRFYSTLFAAAPTVRKTDYAKWMLENPRLNFAISQGRGAVGIHHLGIQAEDDAELAEVYDRLRAADAPVLEEGKTVCCYAQSAKAWITDPQGLAWETFLTTGESTVYGGSGPALGSNPGPVARDAEMTMSCCGPTETTALPAAKASCCGPAANPASSC
jgi:catechol 2,3-dioxygenase-like lactoylglutathione lyase family enzyme